MNKPVVADCAHVVSTEDGRARAAVYGMGILEFLIDVWDSPKMKPCLQIRHENSRMLIIVSKFEFKTSMHAQNNAWQVGAAILRSWEMGDTIMLAEGTMEHIVHSTMFSVLVMCCMEPMHQYNNDGMHIKTMLVPIANACNTSALLEIVLHSCLTHLPSWSQLLI